MSMPSEALDYPYPDESVMAQLSSAMHWTDNFSITWQVSHLIEMLTGRNPIDESMKMWVGDWTSYGVAASAVAELMEYMGQVTVKLKDSASQLEQIWIGKGGDAAVSFLDNAAVNVLSVNEHLAEIRQALVDLGFAIGHACSRLVSCLESAIDNAIILEIEIAAGGASAPTGVGPVIAFFAGSYTAWKIYTAVRDLYTIYNATVLLIDNSMLIFSTFRGMMADLTAKFGGTPYSYENARYQS